MIDRYCTACMQHKSIKYFTMQPPGRKFVCDHCRENFSERMERIKAERVCKEQDEIESKTPVFKGFATETKAKKINKIRARLYELQEQKLIDDFCGDL